MKKKTAKKENTSATATDEWQIELVKCARAWCHYVQITKKELNLTEQAMFDATAGLMKQEREEYPEMEDTFNARDAFEGRRVVAELQSQECLMVVVGYATGRDPFRLLGRVSADTGYDKLPSPHVSMDEMQPVAFAAKMAFAKVLAARKKR